MIMDGKTIKQEILDELKEKVSFLDKKPTLCVIQIGNDEASNIYIKQKKKMCEYIGYNFIHKKFEENITQEKVLSEIDELNFNNDVTSILVQMPIPNHIDRRIIQNRINEKKDVDGLSDINIMNLINKKESLKPCTAIGVLRLLNHYEIPIEGSNVVIVGRSFLVGKPMFYILENENATVTLCHSKTRELKDITRNADILIVAVGHKHLITEDMVKEGAVVIDVGINKIDDKLYGDTDFEKIKNKASYITPVPGGVGPMTIAMLAENIYKSAKKTPTN